MTKLSQYDEKLTTAAKEGIKSAKQNYAKAQANGDETGMAEANAYANSIRRIYGGYTGGNDGSGYYPVLQKPQFSSQYDKMIRNAQKRIIDIKDFSYNPNSDPMYQLYKKVYTQMGNDAYDRAIAQSSIKTGGIVNTNAAASATQAQNFYNSALADKATELYNAAYKRYVDGINREYDILDMLEKADKNDYTRYLDSVDQYKDERDFEYDRFSNELTTALNKISEIAKLNYEAERDREDDIRWREELNYKKQKDQNNLSYNFAKLNSNNAKWNYQANADKYDALAKLAETIYKESYGNIDLDELLNKLGI